jgi:hypothetical protein
MFGATRSISFRLKFEIGDYHVRTVRAGPLRAPFPAVANAEAEATKLNQGALQFMLGAQKMMFEEWVFLGDEMLERTRTEMHLFTEFVAKMAGAHSVKDVKDDVPGMRPASARLLPPRFRTAVQAWRADDRGHVEP